MLTLRDSHFGSGTIEVGGGVSGTDTRLVIKGYQVEALMKKQQR
jgi:hypothetical protein